MTLYARNVITHNSNNNNNIHNNDSDNSSINNRRKCLNNIICQDAEAVLKETYNTIIAPLSNNNNNNYYTKQQQQQNQVIILRINKLQHYIFFLFLGVCLTLCFSFILSISIHNTNHDNDNGITNTVSISMNTIKSNTKEEYYFKRKRKIISQKIEDRIIIGHGHNEINNVNVNVNNKSNKKWFKSRYRTYDDVRMVYYIDLIPRLSLLSNRINKLSNNNNHDNNNHDYNGINYKSIKKFHKGRIIKNTNDNKIGQVLHNEDDNEYNDNGSSDDHNDGMSTTKENEDCEAISWSKDIYPNCNTIHETPLHNTTIISYGYYRDVLEYYTDNKYDTDEIIIKTFRYKNQDINKDLMEGIRIDALVMEKLTFSEYIADIFGYCGTTIQQELFIDDIQSAIITKKDKNYDTTILSNNKFTPMQKLHIALDLALPLYDLHYFNMSGSTTTSDDKITDNTAAVIVHDDIQLGQYLYTNNNKLKLNDFNRAEIMFFNNNTKQYCKYKNGNVYGKLRSPEEIEDRPLNEKIDIFSYGNILYNLLTGLWTFYDIDDDEDAQKKISKGHLSYINPMYKNSTYIEERILVHFIERCWDHNPDNRPTILQIINYLQNSINKNVSSHNNSSMMKMGIKKEDENIIVDWKLFSEEDDEF